MKQETWFFKYRTEIALCLFSFFVLAMFSSARFWRQSEAPHFVYQAQAWLDKRIDIAPELLPNFEDWACVRKTAQGLQRCEGQIEATDRWYSSFPAFPSLVMLPFVAVNGYQFNDTSFGVMVGALAIAAFFSLLQKLTELKDSTRATKENALLALVLGFGTLFFYCAIRGEVWFSAEVMGVALTSLYASHALKGRSPVLAGMFFSMAVLTRTPLLFTGVFFVGEVWRSEGRLNWEPMFKKLARFSLGALPLIAAGAGYNYIRFGSPTEFGHRYFYNNRVNPDIDTYGLFHPHFLVRNLQAAFAKWPVFDPGAQRWTYDPHGLSLFLTFPILTVLIAVLLAKALEVEARWVPKTLPRLFWILWITVFACAVPGFFYQNDGYAQFGFRFSLDYTPYLILLVAIMPWNLKAWWARGLLLLGAGVNLWGVFVFRGYTELVRRW